MYLFEVKESTLKSLVKIEPSMLKKMAVLRQIKAQALLLPRPHSYIFLCFFNVRYKITPVKAYSENLSI